MKYDLELGISKKQEIPKVGSIFNYHDKDYRVVHVDTDPPYDFPQNTVFLKLIEEVEK